MKNVVVIIIAVTVLFFLSRGLVMAKAEMPRAQTVTKSSTRPAIKNPNPCSIIKPIQKTAVSNTNIFFRLGQWFQELFAQITYSINFPIKKPDKTSFPVDYSPCPSEETREEKMEITPTVTIAPTLTPTLTPTPTVSPSRPSAAVIKKTQISLMPLGDSITDGAILPGGYRTELWKKLMMDGDNIDFVGSLNGGPPDLGDRDHQGLIGWTIPQLDGSVGGWIAAYQPDIVLLHIGSNDLDHGATPESMTQSLSKLIGDIFAAKPNVYIIVSTLIPSTHGAGSTWSSFNASIPAIAAQYSSQGRRIIALDMSQVVTGGDLADGIHPNAIGYSKMANMWYPVVTTVYKQLISN